MRWLPLLALLFAAACGGSTDDTTTPATTGKACTPGQQVACACPGAVDGAQACRADGTAFGTCVCNPGGAGGTAQGGTSGSAGSGQAGAPAGAGGAGAGGAGAGGAGAGGAGAGAGGAGAGGAGAGGAGAGAGGTAQGTPATCAAAATAPSSFGCEFWAADLDQQDGGGSDPASAPWSVLVHNPQTIEVTVTVEVNEAAAGGTPSPKTISATKIPAGSSVELSMPTRELDCGVKPNDYGSPGTCLSSLALRLTATAPVAAHQYNATKPSFSNDASMLLPTSALGMKYRAIGVAAGHPVPIDFPGMPKIIDRATLTIIGTEGGTTVTVTPTWRVKKNGPVTSGAIGEPIVVTLGAFDVLNLETDDATNAETTSNPLAADLSGTQIVASKPVAVFSGAETASAPVPAAAPKPPGWSTTDTCCLDHVEEQLLPLEAWGTRYVVPRSQVRSAGFVEPDVLRFVGGDELSMVTTSLAHLPSFALAAGEVRTTYTTTDVVIDATKPIGVASILVPQEFVAGTPTGDPSLLILPPVAEHASDVSFAIPAGWTTTWISVGLPEGATFTVDGASPSACTAPVTTAGYTFSRCAVASGGHRVTATKPFVASVGGYSSASSFWSLCGMRANAL